MQADSACSPSSCCEGDLGKESEAISQASFTALYPDDSCDIKCGAMNLQASIAFFISGAARESADVWVVAEVEPGGPLDACPAHHPGAVVTVCRMDPSWGREWPRVESKVLDRGCRAGMFRAG
eukprot:586261-Rhodomonas_salina.2